MNDIDDKLIYDIALSLFPGVKLETANLIVAEFGSVEAFFKAPEQRLRSTMNLRSRLASSSYRAQLVENARIEAEFIYSSGIKVSAFDDDDYPGRLAACPDAPVVLYSLGECNFGTPYVIGVVGTRSATRYGIDMTRRIIAELAESLPCKPLVVSGLAYGIDITAHREAIARGCPTVAVLGHGLKTIYPAEHRADAARIARGGGALVTEYISSATPNKGSFLARNRIIAGLVEGLLVPESPTRSGSLSTARIASEYGREVMACPGRATDIQSEGCNNLIARNIASLVTCGADIAAVLHWHFTSVDQTVVSEPETQLTPERARVVDYLREHGATTTNRLAIALGIGVGQAQSILIGMEMDGLIVSHPGAAFDLA